MTREDLKQKSFSAVAWSASEALSRQAIQFLTSVVLARLLAPEEFGLMAMLVLFTGLGTAMADGGFTSALIQKQTVTREETSSVFYFNVAMGLVGALMLYAVAPWIAAFYQSAVLQPLTRLMALNLCLSGFGGVHQALLAKALDFRRLTRITVISVAVSGSVAILLAWRGWGVWSLAVQALVATLVSTVLLWCWEPWRPAAVFSLHALRSLFRFGSFLLISSVAEIVYARTYTLIIGKFYSARDLGLYARADGTQQLAANFFSSIMDRVAYPLFSTAASDRGLLKRGVRKALSIILLINAPTMLGLLVTARPLVRVLFGERWSPCVPYLQVLCVSGVLWPLHVINLSALKAMGRSDLFFRVEVVKKVVGFAVIIAASMSSILALAWSQIFLGILAYILNAHYVGVHLDYSAMSQLRDNRLCLLAAGIMGAGVWPLGLIPSLAPALLLALQVGAGALIYLLVCRWLKVPALVEIARELRPRLPWLRVLLGSSV